MKTFAFLCWDVDYREGMYAEERAYLQSLPQTPIEAPAEGAPMVVVDASQADLSIFQAWLYGEEGHLKFTPEHGTRDQVRQQFYDKQSRFARTEMSVAASPDGTGFWMSTFDPHIMSWFREVKTAP